MRHFSKYSNYIFFLSIILLIFSCAAVSSASGGPADILGPVLLSVNPPNGSKEINNNSQFILKFNENLDPQSVPAAVKITPEFVYKIKTRGKFINIIPLDSLPNNSNFRIKISRSIRDYQNNKMADPISLVYSTNKHISSAKIHGQLINQTNESIYSVNLYSLYSKDSLTLYAETESDANGYFNFDYINNGNYRIAALENPIKKFNIDQYKMRYGMSPQNSFRISSGNDSLFTKIFISDNLKKHSITNVKFNSKYHGDLILSNNQKISFYLGSINESDNKIFNNNYPKNLLINYSDNKDTLYFTLNLKNRLHSYKTNTIKSRIPTILDTIRPQLSDSNWESDKLILSFSEPIFYEKNYPHNIDILDSTNYIIPGITHNFNYISPYKIHIHQIIDSLNELKLSGLYFKDFSDSLLSLLDSVISIKKIISDEKDEEAGGIMSGKIIYNGKHGIMVSAKHIKNETISYTKSVNNNFHFYGLETGKYKLFAYEFEDSWNDSTYFSGIWKPYKKSARFCYLDKNIEIRPRWEVQGIELIIEPGIK